MILAGLVIFLEPSVREELVTTFAAGNYEQIYVGAGMLDVMR